MPFEYIFWKSKMKAGKKHVEKKNLIAVDGSINLGGFQSYSTDMTEEWSPHHLARWMNPLLNVMGNKKNTFMHNKCRSLELGYIYFLTVLVSHSFNENQCLLLFLPRLQCLHYLAFWESGEGNCLVSFYIRVVLGNSWRFWITLSSSLDTPFVLFPCRKYSTSSQTRLWKTRHLTGRKKLLQFLMLCKYF